MKLADLIDLEVQIAADVDEEPEALKARDREIYRSLPESPTHSDLLLTRWLAALRQKTGRPDAGRRVVRGQRVASYLLVLIGLATGWGSAAALLHFDSKQDPINVGWFIGALVGLQLVSLLLTVLGLPLLRRFPDAPLIGESRALVRWLSNKAEAWGSEQLSPEAREQWSVNKARLRTRASLYSAVERWSLLALTQTFGVAFNVGVLLGCLRLVVFSDLPFSWSTTVQGVDAAWVHQLVHAMALPFAWLLPEAMPSLELVQSTQYSRLVKSYVSGVPDPRLVGGWWRFMVACVVSYGLLPRCLFIVLAWWRRHAALNNLPLETVAVSRVLRRLRTPEIRTAPQQLAQQKAPAALPAVVQAVASPASSVADVVVWRAASVPSDQLNAAVQRSLDVQARELFDAQSAQTFTGLQAPVVVVVDAWEPPDKAVRRLLSSLRSQIGAQAMVTVALVGEPKNGSWTRARAEDLAIWNDRLTLLQDPYLAVEALEPLA